LLSRQVKPRPQTLCGPASSHAGRKFVDPAPRRGLDALQEVADLGERYPSDEPHLPHHAVIRHPVPPSVEMRRQDDESGRRRVDGVRRTLTLRRCQLRGRVPDDRDLAGRMAVRSFSPLFSVLSVRPLLGSFPSIQCLAQRVHCVFLILEEAIYIQ